MTAMQELIDFIIELNNKSIDPSLHINAINSKAKHLLEKEQRQIMEANMEGHRYYGINDDDKILKLAYNYYYKHFDDERT